MKKIILILLVTIFSYAESTFSDPQPTFDDPRKLVVRLYDADVEKTNHIIGTIYNILKEYVKHAKIIAELEKKMQADLCDASNQENFSTLWKILFETLFNTKEYIFNRSTYKVLYKMLKDELVK